MKHLIIALCLVASLAAQDKSDFAAALKLREESTLAVKEKKETPEASLEKLKAHGSPSGLKIDREADFALAALDVGQRLIAAGEPEAAEKFFRAAEKSLDHVIRKSPESAAREKAGFLRKRAYIRGHFLNRAAEAKTDLEAALSLQPEDANLKAALERLRAQDCRLFLTEQSKH